MLQNSTIIRKRRDLVFTASRLHDPEAVADASDSVDQLHRAILVDLLAEAIYIHLHKIGFTVEMAIPDVLNDLTSRHQIRSVQQEQLKQREFLGGQGHSHFP